MRTDSHQPSLLEIVVKARRTGQLGLSFITADPARQSQLAQAHVGSNGKRWSHLPRTLSHIMR